MDVVRKLLSKLNKSKAAGLDNIPNKLLKMAGDIGAPSLTQIFTKSISTGVFRTEWKLARVSLILRKGKRDDPNNYRPISIILTVAKIFEKIVYDQLYGVERSSLKWFESYLCDRSQKYSINGHLSNIAPVSCDVPQGSNLGPLLFLVYINDLPNCLSLASPRMFADDTNILASLPVLWPTSKMS